MRLFRFVTNAPLTACLLMAAILVINNSNLFAQAELITNGNFETGALAPWLETDQPGGSGTFYINTPAANTPLSGHPTQGTGANGNYIAVTDQTGPGAHAIAQQFVVPGPASSVILSFDMFVNDYGVNGVEENPAGLDYTVANNEQGRVDILTSTATPLDTGAGVLDNLFDGAQMPLDTANPFVHYSFDITSVVGGGGTFGVRFAEVDNDGYFNMGVDNVQILYTAVPEPSTWLMAVLGSISGVGMLRMRRRTE